MKMFFSNKKRIILTCLVVVFAIFFCCGLYDFLFVYHVKLNGNKRDILDVNMVYKDPGISVIYRGKKIKNYKEEDNIDNSKKGFYKIIYSVGNKKITREVEVKDISKPIISLIGGNIYTLSYGDKYKDPGYSASDNNDGDLTLEVELTGIVDDTKLGEYVVTYTVKDSSNNVATEKRIVRVVEEETPRIMFPNGNYNYSIKGKTIDLKDYTIIDNKDKDLYDKVEINGIVDFNKEGLYKVEYIVVDSDGNKTVQERTINVQNKNKKGIPVLMYHWFFDDTKGEEAGENDTHNYISKTNLTNQLKYLKDENFYFPTWKELEDYIDNKIDLPEKSIIITDDDCVDSFFNIALPVFQEYEVPVTSFCITKKSNWQGYVDAPYLNFESHTDSLHVRRCTDTKWNGAVMCTEYTDIYKDILKSIKKLSNNYAFAYPFGHYNDDTIQALKDNNIKLAFTTKSGKVTRNANKYKLPRVRISKTTTLEEFVKKIR